MDVVIHLAALISIPYSYLSPQNYTILILMEHIIFYYKKQPKL